MSQNDSYRVSETRSLKTRWRYDVIGPRGNVVLHEVSYWQAREFVRLMSLNRDIELRDLKFTEMPNGTASEGIS